MLCRSYSALRHTILLGAVLSYISLKHANTTHPLSSTDIANDCTNYTRTRQLCMLRKLAFEDSAAKALRAARILSFSIALGLEPVLRM